MRRRRPRGEPKPVHIPGRTVYVTLRSYEPATKKTQHRGTIKLPKWTPEEVRQIIVDRFTELQKLYRKPEVTWRDADLTNRKARRRSYIT